MAEENLFGRAAAHQHGQHAFEVFLGIGVLVGLRKLHRKAEGHAAGNDRDLVHRIGARGHRGDQCVARLVIRGILLFLVGQDHGLALDAHEHLVFGHFEIGHGDEFAILTGGPESGFIDQVCQIGSGESRSAARDDGKFDIIGKRHLAGVDAQDLLAAFHVGTGNHHATVEASGPKQGGIEHVRTVGGSDQDDPFV